MSSWSRLIKPSLELSSYWEAFCYFRTKQSHSTQSSDTQSHISDSQFLEIMGDTWLEVTGCSALSDVWSAIISSVLNTWEENHVIFWQDMSCKFWPVSHHSLILGLFIPLLTADIQMCGDCCCQYSTSVLKSSWITMFCSGRPYLMCEHMGEEEMESEIKGDTALISFTLTFQVIQTKLFSPLTLYKRIVFVFFLQHFSPLFIAPFKEDSVCLLLTLINRKRPFKFKGRKDPCKEI